MVNQGDEVFPALLLCSERLSPFRCQAVVPSSALLGLLNPPSNDPSMSLEPMEQRVEGGHVKSQSAAGSELNQLRDVISVTRLILEQGQDKELRATLFPLRVRSAQQCALSHGSPTVDNAGSLLWRALRLGGR